MKKRFRDWDPALAKDFIKKFEGFRYSAYQCSAGVWTIAYGHTSGVKEGDFCTEADAEKWLVEDLESMKSSAQKSVAALVNEGQFIALMSFIYNVGVQAFRTSTLLDKLNSGYVAEAGQEFLRWIYVRSKPSAGLAKRRAEERRKFLEGGTDVD